MANHVHVLSFTCIFEMGVVFECKSIADNKVLDAERIGLQTSCWDGWPTALPS